MYADCLPGAKVTIHVDGKPLVEHATENDIRSAETFVEAVAGAKFAVRLDIDGTFAYRHALDQIRFSVYLDGEKAGNLVVSPRSHGNALIDSTYKTMGKDTIRRKFTFAEHATTDEKPHASLAEKLANIGEIRVKLIRCHLGVPSGRKESQSTFTGVGDADISEKALKGRSVSNHVKLGAGVKVQAREHVSLTFPFGKTPIAEYIFQYRSRRDLEIEGILERPPSPVPLEDRNPDELTADELREQVRLLQARQPVVGIKQETKPRKRARERSVTVGTDEDNEGDVTLVSESDRRKRARASMENAEVIDLSED